MDGRNRGRAVTGSPTHDNGGGVDADAVLSRSARCVCCFCMGVARAKSTGVEKY